MQLGEEMVESNEHGLPRFSVFRQMRQQRRQ